MGENTKQWRLGPHLILEESDGQLCWVTWADFPTDGWTMWTGRAWIEERYDLLVLKHLFVEQRSEEKSQEEVDKVLDACPPWDKTSYFVKAEDVNYGVGIEDVRDCKTLEYAPKEVMQKIARGIRHEWQERLKKLPITAQAEYVLDKATSGTEEAIRRALLKIAGLS